MIIDEIENLLGDDTPPPPPSTLCLMGKANSEELVALILQRGKFSTLTALSDNWNHIWYYFSESGKKFQICLIYFLVKGLTVSFFKKIYTLLAIFNVSGDLRFST